MNWKAGDAAIIADSAIAAQDTAKKYIGCHCTLIEFEGSVVGGEHGKNFSATRCWRAESDGQIIWADESVLRKPYDGHDKCSWQDCVWEPDLIGVPVTERV